VKCVTFRVSDCDVKLIDGLLRRRYYEGSIPSIAASIAIGTIDGQWHMFTFREDGHEEYDNIIWADELLNSGRFQEYIDNIIDIEMTENTRQLTEGFSFD